MQNSRRQRSTSLRVTLIVALIVAVVATFVHVVPGARSLFHQAVFPLWRIGSASNDALGGVAASVRSRTSLLREIERLEKDAKVLQLETFELPILTAENQRLQELWQRRTHDESLLGRVLARPNMTPYDTLVIDVGSLGGVAERDLVIVENVAIGRISSVFPRTSLVQLFSAPGVESNVSISTSSVMVVATGVGGGNFVGEVSRVIEVERGSVVVLPDIRARVFAIVEEVQAEASDPFRTILFHLPVNIAEIDWVEVIIEGAYPLPNEGEETEDES